MAIASPEEMVGKASLTASTADAAYSVLRQGQARKLIELVQDQSVMMKLALHTGIEGVGIDLGNIDMSLGKVSGGIAEGTGVTAGQENIPVFGGIELVPKTYRMKLPISTEKLMQVNVEGPALGDTVMRMAGAQLGNDLEYIAINSATGGSNLAGANTGYLTTIEGWREKAKSGHIYDHASGYVNIALFKGMLDALPLRWRRGALGPLRFFTSVKLVDGYVDYISRRSTPFGDAALTGNMALSLDGQLSYRGIPIIGVDYILDTYDGYLEYSGTQDRYGWILLTPANNLAVAWGPQMRMFRHPSDDGIFLYVNWWGQMDVGFPILDAVVTGMNIVPEVNPSLLPAY